MTRQTENHLKFFQGVSSVSMLVKYYDDLPEEDRKKMTMDVCDSLKQLMEFRNVINDMIDFESTPHEIACDWPK